MDSLKKLVCLSGIELKKIYSQRKYQILLALTAGVSVALALLSTSMYVLPYTVLSVITRVLAPLAAMMLAVDLMAGEITQNEIRILLTRPVEKYQISASKTIAVSVYCAGMLMLAGAVSTVLAVGSVGLAGLSILNILLAYTVSVLPITALSAMFVLSTAVFKSVSAAFAGSLVLYFGSIAAGLFFPELGALLPTTYLSLGTMLAGSNIPAANLLTGAALLMGYGCFSFCLSGLVFQKKEFS